MSRAGRIPAANQSATGFCEPIYDQVRATWTCRDSSNLSTTGRKPGLRPAREPVADLASWIAPDRPRSNSITLSSWLAAR